MTGARFDVVVVGAGTSGANAAYQFARRGRRVLLVDRRPAQLSGAQWHNGVLDRHFERADLDPPTGPERRSANSTVHLRGRNPKVGVTLRDSPTVSADMSLLGERLRTLAADAGVTIIDQVQNLHFWVDPDDGRLRSLAFVENGNGRSSVFSADLFVDASGRTGALRRHSPALAKWCPTVRGHELCSAMDVNHSISDPSGALRFLESHDAAVGDTVTFVGVNGGYSTCAVTVSRDLDTVGILVGCIANGRFGSGPRMLGEFLGREPWIGEKLSAGTGVIPLRRPFARFTAPGLALIGDAACQVFPAHGSGIGIGLIAGTMLAEGVADTEDPGDERTLWANYQAPFQHEFGGLLSSYDVLRRATTRLGSDGVNALVVSGIMDERTTRSGLNQQWQVPPRGAAVRSAIRLASNPKIARVMVPSLLRAQVLQRHAASYPAKLDLDALARWDRRTEFLLGELPEG